MDLIQIDGRKQPSTSPSKKRTPTRIVDSEDEAPFVPASEKKRKMNGSGSVKNPVYISVSDDDGEPSQGDCLHISTLSLEEIITPTLPEDTNRPITRSKTKVNKSKRAKVGLSLSFLSLIRLCVV